MTTDMIDLSLKRIAALLPATFPWRAVHVHAPTILPTTSLTPPPRR